MNQQTEYIQCHAITVGEQQIRHEQTPEDDAELELDIARRGLIQPIGVYKSGHDTYQLIWGSRRLAAHKRLGMTEIWAAVVPRPDGSLAAAAARENLMRSGLSLADEAALCWRVLDECAGADEHVAAALGKSITWVRNRLALRDLPPEIADIVLAGRLAPSVARACLDVGDPNLAVSLAQHASAGGWTVAQTRAAGDQMRNCPLDEAAVSVGVQAALDLGRGSGLMMRCLVCGDACELGGMVIVRVCTGCNREIELAGAESAA